MGPTGPGSLVRLRSVGCSGILIQTHLSGSSLGHQNGTSQEIPLMLYDENLPCDSLFHLLHHALSLGGSGKMPKIWNWERQGCVEAKDEHGKEEWT